MSDKTQNRAPVSYQTFLFPFIFSDHGAVSRGKFEKCLADGWYLDAPKKALESGEMIYAGKYSEPDYELLLDEGCDLAIESTMILHTPKVQEMI